MLLNKRDNLNDPRSGNTLIENILLLFLKNVFKVK